MKKQDNLGARCVLKVLNTMIKTTNGGPPDNDDFLPFTIVGIWRGGYHILNTVEGYYLHGGIFKVKTDDIKIINN